MKIKQMVTDTMQIGLIDEETIVLTIQGNDHNMTVDELNDLRMLADAMWQANDLYNYTTKYKEDRMQYEQEKFGNTLPKLRVSQASRY